MTRLLQLIQAEINEDVCTAAAQCLEVLGPVNLAMVSLQCKSNSASLTNALEVYKDHKVFQNYCHVFHLLDEYLTDAEYVFYMFSSTCIGFCIHNGSFQKYFINCILFNVSI